MSNHPMHIKVLIDKWNGLTNRFLHIASSSYEPDNKILIYDKHLWNRWK